MSTIIHEPQNTIHENGIAAGTIKKNFPVTGMSCASCAVSVESMLNAQPGIKKAAVNFAAGTVQVEFTPSVIRPADMKQVIQGIGYDLVIDETEKAKDELENIQQAAAVRL